MSAVQKPLFPLDEFLRNKLNGFASFLEKTKAYQSSVGLTSQLRYYTVDQKSLNDFKGWWASSVRPNIHTQGIDQVTRDIIVSWEAKEGDFTVEELQKMRRYVKCFNDTILEMLKAADVDANAD